MLMVVIGAGASYDSIPYLGGNQGMADRPPLADQLFEARPDFSSAMEHFPHCQAIIPLVQNLPSGRTVEQVLQCLQSEAKDYPKRHHQLAAVRYYLHVMLWGCEHRWRGIAKGVTNYKALLDLIARWRKPHEQVCLVTFNYDTLLEDALTVVGVNIKELDDYIANEPTSV
jgi:hypothetical protein